LPNLSIMNNIKPRFLLDISYIPFDWFKKWENLAALGFAIVLLVLHLSTINLVRWGLIFDESFYVRESWGIVQGEEMNIEVFHPEHPPLAKLFIALGLCIFGLEPIGWRLPSVVFGVVAIVLFYLICQKLTTNRFIPLIATFVFAFENDSFVMSSIAMLDVYGLTFLLGSLLLYLHKKYALSGVILALAVLAKMSMVFGGGIIVLHWLLTRRTDQLRDILRFLIAAPLSFIFLLPLLNWVALGYFEYPWESIRFMLEFHTYGTFAEVPNESGMASRPWEWILSPETYVIWPDPLYRSGASWTLWALIVPSMCYVLYQTVRRRWDSFCLFSFLWFACTYFSWVIFYLITDRVMFRFYFYPSIGAICLALGFLIWKLLEIAGKRESKLAQYVIIVPVITWMVAHFVIFWVMSPMT